MSSGQIHSSRFRVSRYQKKHSPTHSYRHHSSLICFLHLLWSTSTTTNTMFNLHTRQSFSTISPSFLWSTSLPGTLYFILHISSPNHCLFLQHMPIPSQPVLLLNPLLGTLSCSLTPHIHQTILISARWRAYSFSFLMGQVSLPCNIPLCTQLLYNLCDTDVKFDQQCPSKRLISKNAHWKN